LADEDVIETLRNSRKLSRKDALAIRKRMETEKDMQNCFGFDVSRVCSVFRGIFFTEKTSICHNIP
jgi:hypothetical protein